MILRVLACFFLLSLVAIPAYAEDDDAWKLMLQRNYEELQYQIDYVDGVSQKLPGMVKQTRQDLAALRKKLDELMVLARVSGTSPMELRAVLAGLDILKARVDAVTQPFSKADLDMKNFQERLTELEGEFARQSTDGPSTEINKAVADFLGDLRKMKGKLGRVKTVLDQGLNPTNDLHKGIGKLSQTITERIPRAWKDYYLTPGKGFLSVAIWKEAAQRLTDLPRLIAMYTTLFDAGESSLGGVAARLLGLAALLALMAGIGLKRVEARYPGFKVTQPLGSLAWMGLGVSTLWATGGAAFVLVRAETSAVAEILLARGVLGVSWFLRRMQAGEAAPATNPVASAWWMFFLAVLLQMPWLPEALRGGVWVLALFAAGWMMRRRAAVGASASAAPEADAAAPPPQEAKAAAQADLVSRVAAAAGWIYPLLCLPALLGWVNLTLLIVIGWFLLLVFLQAGLALYGLVGRAVSRPAADLTGEAVRSFVGGLALPFTAIAMAAAFLFWLSMAMGGRSVFWSLAGADLGDGDFSLDLTRLAIIFIGFYLARAATRVADRLIAELPSRRPDLERGVLNLLETISTYVIWGLYVLISLRMVGASFTSLAVVAGGLSVGIGFGMQNIINNFISGLILLFGRSVQAGDVLQIGETWGSVQRVNIRNTVVQTFDNATLFVPNSDLITQRIINWSHKDRRVRRALEVGVVYGSDTGKVHALLLEAAKSHPNVLAQPKPTAQFTAFGDTALTFKLLFWVDDLDNAARTSSDIYMTVDRLLRENNIAASSPRKA
ncbi:mechanosensitive ion channel family protein [Fundidesulfovibrio putealis]|uniref:mechanosensitive ion channel family protein n=1 Tax=Fundidesulfovibrio putealis TaxID=270496 RepID=UPI0003FE02D9|nr:mechanosensitive ion channel domain-containing protein [Fundidesulfovibrio putealis]